MTPLDLFVVPVAIEGGLYISAFLVDRSIVNLHCWICPRDEPAQMWGTGE